MNRKAPVLIVAMSLSFVLIITMVFMLSNLKGISSTADHQKPGPELPQENTEDRVDANEEAIVVETEETGGLDNAERPGEDKNLPPDNSDSGLEAENALIPDDALEEANQAVKEPPEGQREKKKTEPPQTDNHLNRKTNNTNILCLGVADHNLEMISVYSINKENRKSAGVFLPTRTTLKVNGEMFSLQEIYHKYGVRDLKKIVSQCLEVDIPYHMVADKQGLVELSELIGPLYVENENIDIPDLFVRPTSDKDDKILQSLADRITQPKMILQVPKLIKIFIANVESDIGVSGLWELYKVFGTLNHAQLAKIVLWGEQVKMAGEEYWFIPPYDWHNVVYEMTK
ncbi:MAG: hypothetical protein ACOWWO_19180 [Peptococcaceae bacterium]